MKFTTVVFLSAAATATASVNLRPQFDAFVSKHGKKYATADEHSMRFAVFAQNVKNFERQNADLIAAGKDAIHGVTKFSDLTLDEWRKTYLGARPPAGAFPNLDVVSSFPKMTGGFNVTGAYKLSDDGFLTDVKDQAQCGSCWAFAATEAIESANAIAGHALTVLSPQQIVSCQTADWGCSGGWPSDAIAYVASAGGLSSETDYPYTSMYGDTGVCKNPLPAPASGAVTGWSYATPPCSQGMEACVEDSETLANAVHSFGGIAIAIDATGFFSYTGGIMTSASCNSSPNYLDHAVQVVGYDTTGATPYWIVRNSWATSWGEAGFVRMEMGGNT